MLLPAYAVFFNRAALRRISLILLCHPGPLCRKCSMTSGSSRSETSFFGASAFGRPRRISLSPWYRSACSNHSFVNSGASSGSTHLLAPVLFFVGMTVPHRDDVPRIATRCPNDHHHPATERARRDHTMLAIVKTVVDSAERWASKYQFGIGEVQATFLQRGLTLCRVEGDLHRHNVATKKSPRKIFVATEKAPVPEAAA